MRTAFILLNILIYGICLSQSQTTGYKAEKSDINQKILEKGRNYDVNFDIKNHDAFYLDGEEAMFMEIYKRLNIPQSAVDAYLDATAMISLKVNFNGKVLDPTSISKVGHGIDEQILEILKTLEFVPATQGGTPYRSEVIIEIPIKARYIADAFKK